MLRTILFTILIVFGTSTGIGAQAQEPLRFEVVSIKQEDSKGPLVLSTSWNLCNIELCQLGLSCISSRSVRAGDCCNPCLSPLVPSCFGCQAAA